MKKINSRQPKQKHLLSKVMKECACALRFPLLLNTVTAILTGVVGVAAANKLGKFADAVFQLNLPLSLRNIVALAACMAAVVFVVPGLGLLSDFVMLKSALRHDTIVFGHYLDKEPQKAMALNRGELQYQLEDAPNELRIYWVNLLSKLLSLPFCLGYLLYC